MASVPAPTSKLAERGYTDKTARIALRRTGLRVTAPRAAVLMWLSRNPHATVDHIKSGVYRRLGSVSTQAVYDVLAACSSAGLVRRIEPAGHPARYECRVGDNHHHLVCRTCGRTEDIDCAVGNRPCLTPNDAHGFDVDEAEVVFWGRCPRCQTDAAQRSDMSQRPRRSEFKHKLPTATRRRNHD